MMPEPTVPPPIPDIAFSWTDEYVDREANSRDVRLIELIQEGERVVYRTQDNDDPAQEWPGRISAHDPVRGLAKLLFDNTGFAFIKMEGERRRFTSDDDNFTHAPLLGCRLDPDDPGFWQLVLGYFCAALGVAEGRVIDPGQPAWNFRPLDWSPWYINAWVEGKYWTSSVPHDELPWFACGVELAPGYVIRAFYRRKGGYPIALLRLDCPDRLDQASLYLRPVGNLPSCLRIHNAMGRSTAIRQALTGFGDIK
jgi:hypothetical protein